MLGLKLNHVSKRGPMDHRSLWSLIKAIEQTSSYSMLRHCDRHFADIFKFIFFYKNCILIQISLQIVNKGPIKNKLVLVLIMAAAEQAIIWTSDGLFSRRICHSTICVFIISCKPKITFTRTWWRHQMESTDDVIKGNPLVIGGQWRRNLMFSLICA